MTQTEQSEQTNKRVEESPDEVQLDKRDLKFISKHLDKCQKSFQNHNKSVTKICEKFSHDGRSLADHLSIFVKFFYIFCFLMKK